MINITARKTYGDRTILNVYNLDFVEGRCYALIGANGSGKSTLLKVLDNQLKTVGEKHIDKNLSVAYMPQNSYAFSMSVKRNILLPISIKDKKTVIDKFDYLVEKLGLKELLHKNATKLSGGETQRMALARTIMVDADVLLLDEPTSAMDVSQAEAVVELIEEEKKKGKTIIFATHSLKQAERLADEIIYMSDGAVVERGVPQEVLGNPKYDKTRQFVAFVK